MICGSLNLVNSSDSPLFWYDTPEHKERVKAYLKRMERPVIWLKTPKCAGTSIKEYLIKHKIDVIVMSEGNWKSFRQSFPEAFDSAFKFMVSRNPYDRTVSNYFYFRKFHKYGSFLDFIKLLIENLSSEKWHHLKEKREGGFDLYSLLMHSQPITGVYQVDGEPVDLDFIVKYENLTEDLSKLFEKLGFPKFKGMGHTRKTFHKPYFTYYNQQTQDLVYDFFQDEFKFFGYGKEIRAWSSFASLVFTIKKIIFIPIDTVVRFISRLLSYLRR